jgi:hypothetical protein
MEKQNEIQEAKSEIAKLNENNSSLNNALNTKINELNNAESDIRQKKAKIADL